MTIYIFKKIKYVSYKLFKNSISVKLFKNSVIFEDTDNDTLVKLFVISGHVNTGALPKDVSIIIRCHSQWWTRPEKVPTVFPITNVAGGCKTLHQRVSIIHVQVPNHDATIPRRPHQPRRRRRRDKAHAWNSNGVDILGIVP